MSISSLTLKLIPFCHLVRHERPAEPSIYSFPPLQLIISSIWIGIRSTYFCILSCSSLSQHLSHCFSSSFFEVEAPFCVVFLFIYYQQGSIAFKSGELPGQRSFLSFARLKRGSWCFDVYAGAPSSWTRVPGYASKCRFAQGRSFFLRITSWYLYQSIPPFLVRTAAPVFAVYFQTGFFPGLFRSPILAILVSSSQAVLWAASVRAFLAARSSFAAFFSFAVSSFQIWQGPFS